MAAVGRKMGVSEQSLSRWKAKYAGLCVGELREMRQLREENHKLKQVVADLTLEKHILQEAMSQKRAKPAAKRAMATWAQKAYQQVRAPWLQARWRARPSATRAARTRRRHCAGACVRLAGVRVR